MAVSVDALVVAAVVAVAAGVFGVGAGCVGCVGCAGCVGAGCVSCGGGVGAGAGCVTATLVGVASGPLLAGGVDGPGVNTPRVANTATVNIGMSPTTGHHHRQR